MGVSSGRTMRLQRVRSRSYKSKTENKDYYKFVVTLPNKAIKKLGWKKGLRLTVEVKDGGLFIGKGGGPEHTR